MTGNPSGATTITVGGQTITLGDWVEDKTYETVDLSAGWSQRTGDPRRWPDIGAAADSTIADEVEIYDERFVATVLMQLGLDPDLADVVRTVLTTTESGYNPESDWAIANVIDAAGDEQDRRDGKPRREPRPTPAPLEAFTVGYSQVVYGVGINFKRGPAT